MKSYVKPNGVGDFLDIDTFNNIVKVVFQPVPFFLANTCSFADIVCVVIPDEYLSKWNPELSATQARIDVKFSAQQ